MGISMKDIVKVGSNVVKEAGKSPVIQKALFGTYTNGEPRNLADAMNGEIVHPEDRLRITKRIEKHEKKKEKRKKKGQKYAKIDLDKLAFTKEED